MTQLYEKILLRLCARRGWTCVHTDSLIATGRGLGTVRRRTLHRLRKRQPDLLRRARREHDAIGEQLVASIVE